MIALLISILGLAAVILAWAAARTKYNSYGTFASQTRRRAWNGELTRQQIKDITAATTPTPATPAPVKQA